MPITQSRMLEVLASAKLCQDTLARLAMTVRDQITRAQANAQPPDLTFVLLEHAVADAKADIQLASVVLDREAKHFATHGAHNAKMAERMAKQRARRKGPTASETNGPSSQPQGLTYEEQQTLYSDHIEPTEGTPIEGTPCFPLDDPL